MNTGRIELEHILKGIEVTPSEAVVTTNDGSKHRSLCRHDRNFMASVRFPTCFLGRNRILEQLTAIVLCNQKDYSKIGTIANT